MDWLIYGMIYLGSALMVYNVYSYVRYARNLQKKKDWGKERSVLYIPIVLLMLFLMGYLAVGIFGRPDIIIAGILFGGSIFVFIIFYLLQFITNRVQESEHLEAKLAAAEESSRTKNIFLSSVSHEMRTPMNAIIGLDFLALKDPTLKPVTRRQFEKIDENARHLMSLIDNILDMSAIDSGKMVLREGTFSLYDMLENINVIMRGKCIWKNLLYSSSIIGNLDDFYVGDQGKLKQVLLSLLDNAVKFTEDSGTITFSAEQTESSGENRVLRFVISDSGIGIDAEFLPKIFDPFAKENSSTTDRYGGIGLSLTVSQKIIELMLGSIDVKSEKGSGSTFTVCVKLGASDRKAAPKTVISVPEPSGSEIFLTISENEPDTEKITNPADEQEVPADQTPDTSESDKQQNTIVSAEAKTADGSVRILIVEDVDLNAEILADLLEMEDITSERAENGEIALKMFSEKPINHYDAILMDLRMPVMDGLEATRKIRSLNRPDAVMVPIIALTANASQADSRNVMEAGMNYHLSKPVDSDLLLEALTRFVPRMGKSV